MSNLEFFLLTTSAYATASVLVSFVATAVLKVYEKIRAGREEEAWNEYLRKVYGEGFEGDSEINLSVPNDDTTTTS